MHRSAATDAAREIRQLRRDTAEVAVQCRIREGMHVEVVIVLQPLPQRAEHESVHPQAVDEDDTVG